jgi:hypothetical protein
MVEDSWELLEEVPGTALAEMLRGLLEAQGIQVLLSQEGLGHSVYTVTVGIMGEVQILVPKSQLESARKVIDEYNAGVFEEQKYDLDGEKPIDNVDQVQG